MQFRLLGAVEADDDGRPVAIGHARQRCVLAGLLTDANSVVSVHQLVERVWGGQQLPAHPDSALQTYVSLIRRSIPGSGGLAIARRAAGYQAIVSPQAVDLHRFRQLIGQARATADDEEAAALFGEALSLWQGEAFAGLDSRWICAMRTTLTAERLAAQLDLADIHLRQGRNAIAAAELSGLVADHPLDEHIAGRYITALHGSGRPAEALAHFQQIRRRLAEELGADPDPTLQRLHQQILTGQVPGGQPGGRRPVIAGGHLPEQAPAWGERTAAVRTSSSDRAALLLRSGFSEVAALVRGHLGPAAAEHAVAARVLPRTEHVNLQRAIDAWSAQPGRRVQVHGITVPGRSGGLTMQDVLSGDGLAPAQLTAPPLTDLPDGPGSAHGCLRRALLLAEDAAGRYVVLIEAPHEDHSQVRVEIAGLPAEQAQRLHAELDQLRSDLNVYRGRLLEVTPDPIWGILLDFAEPSGLTHDDVVLPPAVLARIERYALGVAARRKQLLDAGLHLKRGLLLYGPPGTGKTHTTRYLLCQMQGYTRLVLSGSTLTGIRQVTDLARALLPAVVVIEDVDLLTRDRSASPGSSPELRDLLEVMDNAEPEADLLFLMTTSRPDSLDTALTRPGRVDAAVQISLPEAPARQRLLALYGRNMPLDLTPDDITTAVKRTDGTTASFLKELMRRSVLEAVHDDAPAADCVSPAVTGAHLTRALNDLLGASTPAETPPSAANGYSSPFPSRGRPYPAARRRGPLTDGFHSSGLWSVSGVRWVTVRQRWVARVSPGRSAC